MPAVGWLGARVGTKRLFILSTLVFIAGSALCGLAWDVHSLIFFRILQGMGGGPITPLSMSILYSTFPPDKRGLAHGPVEFQPFLRAGASPRPSAVISSRPSIGGRFFTSMCRSGC